MSPARRKPAIRRCNRTCRPESGVFRRLPPGSPRPMTCFSQRARTCVSCVSKRQPTYVSKQRMTCVLPQRTKWQTRTIRLPLQECRMRLLYRNSAAYTIFSPLTTPSSPTLVDGSAIAYPPGIAFCAHPSSQDANTQARACSTASNFMGAQKVCPLTPTPFPRPK
jgi:hypothetical protein